MSTDLCALCRVRDNLQEGHLLPKALYRLIRDPVHVTREGTFRTSSQITCRLLCQSCEQRFSKNGERIVIKECYRGAKNFILRDKLRSETPFASNSEFSCFSAASIPSVDVEAYRYFVASVIWRGSVGRWRQLGNLKLRDCLSPSDEQAIRRYLLGETPFPEIARVLVFVWADATPRLDCGLYESSEKIGSYQQYIFSVPGIEFRLLVGEEIDSDAGRIFARMSSNIAFDLRERLNDPRIAEIDKRIRNSPVRGSLRGPGVKRRSQNQPFARSQNRERE